MLGDPNAIPRLSIGIGDGVNRMCGMQAISWQTGDAAITDNPSCSSRYLSRLVQHLNDELADEQSGYLSASDSMDVLDLGWLTVGTASADDAVAHKWFADLLDNQRWGVIRFLGGRDRAVCKAVAQHHRMAVVDRVIQWADGCPAETPVGERTALQHLSMYVVRHASAESARSLESAVGMACHCNFYHASCKAERIRWVRNAIESWLSWQGTTESDDVCYA